MNFYAGVGSRKTPKEKCEMMTRISSWLETQGLILRSGGASGADKAFEDGVRSEHMKEIYRATDCQNWARMLASEYNPAFWTLKPYVQNLIGRNMQIILGKDGDSPVQFVLCWAKSETSGGTSYGIKCALDNGIEVYNLYHIKRKRFLYKELLKHLQK